MGLILFLILITVSGLVVGALGRLALPGPDPMTVGQTILVGIGGSLGGGIVSWLIFGRNGGSLLLSIAFAALIVYLIRRSRGGSITHPSRSSG